MPSTKLKQLGLSLVLALVTAVTYADQALDEFFENLRTTTSEQEARDTERAIWAIWHNPGDESLRKLYRQGQNLMSAGRLTEAQNTFSELIIRAPGFAEAWNQRATAFYFSNDYDASLADIDHTLTLEPRHYGALFGKALIFTALTKYAKVAAALDEVERINPHARGIARLRSQIESGMSSQDI